MIRRRPPAAATQGRKPAGGSAGAVGLVLGQITSLQLGSTIAKDLFGRAGPTGTAGLRIIWTALVLCALVRPRITTLTGPQLRACVAFGGVVAAMNLAYFHAIALMPIGVASTLELLGPLTLSLLLSRQLRDLLWAALAIGGVLLLATPGAALAATGLAFGVAAAVLRAGYVILSQHLGQLFDDWTGLAVAMACAAAFYIPVLAFSTSTAELLHPATLAQGLAVAVLSSLLPYSLDLLTLRRISPRLFGVLLSATPAIAAVVGFLALGEVLAPRQLAAIALVIAASVAAVYTHDDNPAPNDHRLGG